MLGISITFDEPAWPDLAEILEQGLIIPTEDISVAVLDGGTDAGRPSVALRINLDDGRVVVAQTSARLFCAAARAITGRYPDLFED